MIAAPTQTAVIPAKVGSEGVTQAPPHPDLLPRGEKEFTVRRDSRLRGHDGYVYPYSLSLEGEG